MLKFRTQFPIQSDVNIKLVLEGVYRWIKGSKHYKLESLIDNKRLLNDNDGFYEINGETLNYNFISNGSDDERLGVEFIHTNEKLSWMMHVIAIKNANSAWISIETHCDAKDAGTKIPESKRPILIDRILELLQFGRDGSIDTIIYPHNLLDAEIDLAKAIVLNEANNIMPVVYLSATPLSRHSTNPSILAKKLAGMAHVFVEPNRTFSNRLRLETNSQNPFGGQIGIFWPDSGAREILNRYGMSSDEFINEIAINIQKRLLVKVLKQNLSWNSFQRGLSQYRISEVTKKNEQNEIEQNELVSEWLKEKDEKYQENEKTWKSIVDELESEKERLYKEIQRLEANESRVLSGQILKKGNEDQLYPDEFLSIFSDILDAATDNVQIGNRRYDVLKSLRDANPRPDCIKQRNEKLKEIMHDYNGLNTKKRMALEQLGFDILEDGKHYKLTLNHDCRYSVALAKTPSDNRGAMNWVADLKRKFF